MAKVAEVTDQSFQSEVLEADKPAIIDFWAEWCGPCRQIAPIMSELAEEYGDRVKIVKMDIDQHPNTPGQFNVRAIPTIIAFKNGQPVQELRGAHPKARFKAMVEELLA